MIRSEYQLEKIDRLKKAISTHEMLQSESKKMLYQQIQILEDRIAELQFSPSNREFNFFQRGFLFGVCRMLNISIVHTLIDFTLLIDGDRLITEIETDGIPRPEVMEE